MNEFDSQPWLGRARALLDESVLGIDAATLSRLNRARQAALAQRGSRAARLWWLPAGLATSCALLVAFGLWHSHVPAPGQTTPLAAILAPSMKNPQGMSGGDAGIVAGDDALEFYQDLEFYAWLDAQDSDSDG